MRDVSLLQDPEVRVETSLLKGKTPGTYEIWFTPEVAGDYVVQVTVSGKPIPSFVLPVVESTGAPDADGTGPARATTCRSGTGDSQTLAHSADDVLSNLGAETRGMVRSRSSRIPLSSVAAPPAAPSPPPAVAALPTATPAETRTPPPAQPPAVTAAGAPSLATDIDALFEQLQAEAAAFAGDADADAGTPVGWHARVVSERILLTVECMGRMRPPALPGADGATGAAERPATATPDRPLRQTPQGATPLSRALSTSASASNVPAQLARDRAESDAVSDAGAAPGLAQRARSAVPVVPPHAAVDEAPAAAAAPVEPAPAPAASAAAVAAAAIARDPLLKQLLQQIDELVVTRTPALRALVRAQARLADDATQRTLTCTESAWLMACVHCRTTCATSTRTWPTSRRTRRQSPLSTLAWTCAASSPGSPKPKTSTAGWSLVRTVQPGDAPTQHAQRLIQRPRRSAAVCSLPAVQMEDEAEVERLVASRDAARSQCTNVLRRNLASASTAERLASRVAERDARLAQLATAAAAAPESDAAEGTDMDAWRHAFYRDVGAQMETTNRLMQELLASIQEEVRLHRQHADLLQQGPVAIGRAAAARLRAPARTALRARVEHWLALLRQWSAMADATVRLPPAEDLAQLVETVRHRRRSMACGAVSARVC